MQYEGSMSHSQGLSNNSYPDPNKLIPRTDTRLFKIIQILSSHLRLAFHKVPFL